MCEWWTKHIYFDVLNALIVDKKKDSSNFDKDKFVRFEHFWNGTACRLLMFSVVVRSISNSLRRVKYWLLTKYWTTISYQCEKWTEAFPLSQQNVLLWHKLQIGLIKVKKRVHHSLLHMGLFCCKHMSKGSPMVIWVLKLDSVSMKKGHHIWCVLLFT